MKKLLFTLGSLILFLTPLGADECLENLLNSKVTSPSKIPQKVSEAASIVTLIKKEEIDKYGWTTINEILSHQPGFTPSQDYDRRTVSFRGSLEGWNNNHTLLLIDGIPFNDNLYGSAYTWEITPLFLTKSIEIIRGHSSALYGSSSSNGVVNIQTVSRVEADIFYYDGDNEHNSNVNLDGDYSPVPENATKPIRPWLEYIENEPVKNIGIYGQFTSGDILGEKLTATVGIRYDNESFDYRDILQQPRPRKYKSFSDLSPRFGLVNGQPVAYHCLRCSEL